MDCPHTSIVSWFADRHFAGNKNFSGYLIPGMRFFVNKTTLSNTLRLKPFLSPRKFKKDLPEAWQMSFQDSATPVMEGVIDLHHNIMFFMFLISFFVFYLIFYTIVLFIFPAVSLSLSSLPTKRVHNTDVEVVWTVTPGLTLLCIAFPSFSLLYKIDENIFADFQVKVYGNQWY